MAILVDRNIPFEPCNITADKFGHFTHVSGKLYNKPVVLANVHAPNVDDVQFFNRFFSELPDLNSKFLILGGDFNCYLDAVLDRSSPKPTTLSKSASYIKAFLDDFSLSDPWRFLYPTGREYSFFSHVHHTYTRIDYFFIDNKFISNLKSCKYESIVISDHAPLVLVLAFPDADYTRRHWRLNPLLLSDESFLSHISTHIKTFLSINRTPDVSNKTIWEAMKAYLRGEIISFSAYKNKCSKQKQTDIANQILNIDKQHVNSPSPDLYKERLKLQAEFNVLSSHEVESLLLRSKSNYYEHGGKTGKLLATQLRGLRMNQLIAGVQTDNGCITSDQKEINDKFRTFYSNLYSSDCTADFNIMENFFNNLDSPSLSQDLRNNLDAPITQEEISAAISSMQSG